MNLNVPLGAVCKPAPRTFKQELAERFNHYRWRWAVWAGYYTAQGEPLRCTKCDSWHPDHHVWTTTDTINGYCAEGEISCKLCGNAMGYWAYGHWQPF